MNIDPNKRIEIELPVGSVLAALAALGKLPYEQVAQHISVIESALQGAMNADLRSE